MKQLHTSLPDDYFNKIHENAKNDGITVSSYIIRTLDNPAQITLKIDFADLDKFTSEIQEYISVVRGLCPIIAKSNKAYDRDVQDITESVLKMDEKLDEIWQFIVDTRTRLYDDTRKQLYMGIKMAKKEYKIRRKSSKSKKIGGH